ncbi:MAG: biotin/lipoyl-binding protein, partial [Chromatiaceae bacterium]|nr:biotin/lipoyl-binding protein [Chromatiaceae bacterium]
MSTSIQVTVPDIGDFKDVAVIEVLVAAGDQVAKEDSLITLESDKATMEIPSPEAGRVAALEVEVGDKLSEGDLILILEAEADEAASQSPSEQMPKPERQTSAANLSAQVVVLGAGPGGYTAAFRAA